MTKEQVMGLIRHAFTFIGGFIISRGLVTEGVYADIVGGLMTLIGGIWSLASKK